MNNGIFHRRENRLITCSQLLVFPDPAEGIGYSRLCFEEGYDSFTV